MPCHGLLTAARGRRAVTVARRAALHHRVPRREERALKGHRCVLPSRRHCPTLARADPRAPAPFRRANHPKTRPAAARASSASFWRRAARSTSRAAAAAAGIGRSSKLPMPHAAGELSPSIPARHSQHPAWSAWPDPGLMSDVTNQFDAIGEIGCFVRT
jgi:hypothetical protein